MLSKSVYGHVHARLMEHNKQLADRFANFYNVVNTVIELDEQVKVMNNFWRVQFGLLEVDTLDVRSCLVDGVSAEVWANNFDKYILKTAVKYGLPLSNLCVAARI